MTPAVRGITGTLLPERYVATELERDMSGMSVPGVDSASLSRHITRWWTGVTSRCGPASPARVIFDDVAMPLFGMLGFRAHDVVFDGPVCHARLTTPGGAVVALVIAAWASRPSSRWADTVRYAHRVGASWGLVLAPPFLSVVPTAGHATRRSLDFSLTTLIESGSARYLATVLHASRFDVRGDTKQSALDTTLERANAHQADVRADLQSGVVAALEELAPAIRTASRAGRGDTATPGDQALTIVYRILFLLFAESRQLLPGAAPVYAEGYAVGRLCHHAIDGASTGLWDALAATSRLSRLGCHAMELRVAPFNGALFARAAAPALERRDRRMRRHAGGDARDSAAARALVALGSRRTPAGLESIQFRDLGVEQLGAVYERVLDLPTTAAPDAGRSVVRGSRHSRARRETGTFYTPQPLAELVVRRTLAPLVDGATADDILQLRVLDPAMGSGAFLVAACRYLATAYEDALVAEGRLAPEDADDHERANMRRLVAERCLAGVDRNGTAVQLARLSLWLATLAEGRPLGFLDHRLRTGDSLVGAWPDDLRRASTRTRQDVALPLFDAADLDHAVHSALEPIARVLQRPDDSVADVHAKEQAWRAFTSDVSPLHRWRVAAHIWCARWFTSHAGAPDDAETRALVDAVVKSDRTLPAGHIARRLHEATATAAAVGFFHWPLEFPDVFFPNEEAARRGAGFDAVIGNPPWEMLRREPGDAEARAGAFLRYVRQSGQFPSCATGHLNLYQAFVDRSLSLVRRGGRIGLVLPWGIATDDGSQALRRRLLRDTRLDLIAGIDNASGIFPIHRGVRMAVMTTTRDGPTDTFNACFGVREQEQLDALPARGSTGPRNIRLSMTSLERTSGPSLRIPDLRRTGDLDLLTSLNGRFPRLGSPDGWHVTFGRELNATDVRHDLGPGNGRDVAAIEGKHLAPFVVDSVSAQRLSRVIAEQRLPAARFDHPRVGYRDVSGVANRLTLIAAVVPAGCVTTHTVFVVKDRLDLHRQDFLCACLNSFVLNAIVRMLMGGHVTTTLAEALPVPVWRGDATDGLIARLARQLAAQQGSASAGPRLQALVAHRFGLTHAEFVHVLDGFPLVPADERAATLRWFEG